MESRSAVAKAAWFHFVNSVLFSRLGSEFQDSGYALDLLRLSRREINEFYAIAETVALADYCSDTKNHPGVWQMKGEIDRSSDTEF